IAGGADAFGARLKAAGVFCAPRYIQKPAFECQVLRDRKTYGASRCPYSCRERQDGVSITYDAADYPGTVQGLERVLVLPWNQAYPEAPVHFPAHVVRAEVAELSRRPQ